MAHFKNNPAQALAHGGMTCNSGYYHGVIERAFAGVPREEVTRIARHLCTGPAVTKEEFLLYQCVHGLGHGLMIYSGLDLPWSLQTCDRLQSDFDRVSCTGGVFMQNLMPGMGTSRYLRQKDPIYPCNAVAERHKVYCYLMVTSRILSLDGYDWHKTAAWCRRSEKGWVATCFQSYGRDASGFSQYQPQRTVRLCLEAGDDAGECLYGAARDYGNNYAGGVEAARLCNLAPAAQRGRCFEGIGTIRHAAPLRKRLEQRHLENLVALLLAAGEADVDASIQEVVLMFSTTSTSRALQESGVEYSRSPRCLRCAFSAARRKAWWRRPESRPDTGTPGKRPSRRALGVPVEQVRP